MIAAFLHGWFLCLGLILPLGVQNVFVFNQGARHRRWAAALPTVVTAGVCDSLLILLAVGGVSLIVVKTPLIRYGLTGLGFVFLLYMGFVTWRSKARLDTEETGTWPPRRQILFAASVSLLNPHAIIDTVGVVGTSSLSYRPPLLQAFTGGCLLNSWLWFIGLMTAGHFLRALPRAEAILRWFNRASALIMWGCAIVLVRQLFVGG